MPTPPARTTPERPLLALLRAGIPLTLLIDLLGGDPRSAEIYASEGCRKAS